MTSLKWSPSIYSWLLSSSGGVGKTTFMEWKSWWRRTPATGEARRLAMCTCFQSKIGVFCDVCVCEMHCALGGERVRRREVSRVFLDANYISVSNVHCNFYFFYTIQIRNNNLIFETLHTCILTKLFSFKGHNFEFFI